MKEDKERWNRRFNDRPMVPGRVPEFIEDRFANLASGSVLDIASGDGSVSLHLAEKGFEVTALDISDVALKRLNMFAEEKDLKVATLVADLDQSADLKDLPQFDYIVMAHFKPKIEYWPIFASLLKPGGYLFLTTFNWHHHQKNNFSRRFCLEEEELFNISEELALIHHASVLRNGIDMDDYQFRRV